MPPSVLRSMLPRPLVIETTVLRLLAKTFGSRASVTRNGAMVLTRKVASHAS